MLSHKAKYALQALLGLAVHRGEGPVSAAVLARQERVPRPFLELILLELKGRGLVRSTRGPGGGYALARPPSRITVGEVIRIVDGPLALLPCVSVTSYRRCEECVSEEACGLRRVFLEVREATAGILDATSLADVLARSGAARPRRRGKQAPTRR